MTFILFLIFAVIVFGAILLFSLLRGVSSLLFGKQSYSSGNRRSGSYTENQRHKNNTDFYSSKEHRKVFSKDEGEYVSYEEIKE